MKKFTFLILALFLHQSLLMPLKANSIDKENEEFLQKLSKEKPNAYARTQKLMQAFGHDNSSSDFTNVSKEQKQLKDGSIKPISDAFYKKLLAKEGPLTIEFSFKEDSGLTTVRVLKTTSNGTSLCLFNAKDELYSNAYAPRLKPRLKIEKQTQFAQILFDAPKWKTLKIDDGRNKLTINISPSGNLTLSSGQCLDTLEIKTPNLLTFTGNLSFSAINLNTDKAQNAGVLKVETLALKQFTKSKNPLTSTFINTGYLELSNLQIDSCTFFNEKKLTSEKPFHLNIENGEFENSNKENKIGEINVKKLILSGIMGTFTNNGKLEVVALQGTVQKFDNEGSIDIRSSRKEAVYLIGQTFKNKKIWQSTCGMNLLFKFIENLGTIAAPSLKLQAHKSIQNHANAKLHADQLTINGKCSLTNKGVIISEHELSLKTSSAINEGFLLAKSLIKIDNNGNYFTNTAEGKIHTDGILQIAATGPWWINEGEIIADKLQLEGSLFNVKTGKIVSQQAKLNGQLFNDANLKFNKLDAQMQSIKGTGKLVMNNGQIKIDKEHVHLGDWSCSGKCDWTATDFSNFGKLEGKTTDQTVDLRINSNKEFWNKGKLYCDSGASCKTTSVGKTVNMESSELVTNGKLTQESTNSNLQLESSIKSSNDEGIYYASAPSGNIIDSNTINLGGSVKLEAGKNVEIAPKAKIISGEDTILNGENVMQKGEVETNGKFISKAEKLFENSGKMKSEKGFFSESGEKFLNTASGTIANKKGVLEIKSPQGANKGNIVSKEDLAIYAYKLFFNEGGTIRVGRDAVITADTLQNEAGRIFVGHLLTIHAKKLENKRAPTIMKPGEDCPQPSLWQDNGWWGPFGWGRSYGKKTCQGAYEEETSDGSIISSMGDIVLDVGDGTNLGSTIYAKGDITITGQQFRNLAHNLKNYKVNKTWRHWETCNFFGMFGCDDHYEPDVTEINEPNYVDSTLGADGNIKINNQNVNKQNANNGEVKGFENTGNVKAGKTLNLVSEDETTKFINGLFDSYTKTAKSPKLKTGNFKIYEKMDALGNLFYFRTSDIDEKDPGTDKKVEFIMIPIDEADQKTLNQQVGAFTGGLSERPQIAYLQNEDNNTPLAYRFIMHPQLIAQIIESMFIMQLGTSHLTGFEDKTSVEQFLELEANGFKYAQEFANNSNEDALPLNLEQIKNAKETFIYYELVKHGNEIGYAPVLHFGEIEARKQVPATEGVIQAKNIQIIAGDFKNTGTIKSTGDLKIKAYTFENRKRDHKETEIVKEQDGFWGGTRTRVFEIRTREIGGDIIGLNIEIEAEKDIKSDGGKFVGVQKIYLVSKKGNIEHKAFIGKHVVRLHQCSWDISHGRSSAEEALDYYPAEMISGGDIVISAKAGKVLVEASNIIGTGDVNISGQNDVTIKALMSKYKSYDAGSIFNRKTEETVITQRPNIISEKGNVNINAPEGSVTITATTVNAPEGKIFLEAKDRITLATQNIQYKKSMSEAAGGFSIGGSTTEIVQTAVEETVINALKGITMKAGEDNVLEAVLMNSGKYIHIVAGRDNHFKGFAKQTDIKTHGWNIGISFPGSEAVEALMKGNKGDAIKSLRDGDPLLSAINNLRQAQDAANKIGAGTHVAIEALRALDQYVKMSSQQGATAIGMLGQRMGLTDSKGDFAPTITFHVGTFKSQTHMSEILETMLNAQENIEITSKQNTDLSDGTKVNGDRIYIVAKDVTMNSAKNTMEQETKSATCSVSFGLNNVGFSGAVSNSQSDFNSVTHDNEQLNGKTLVDIKATNMEMNGANINSKNVILDIEKNLKIESLQDTASGSSTSVNIGGGAGSGSGSGSGSGAFSYGSQDKARVNVPSGIKASESLKIKVGDTLHLIGGVIDGPKNGTDIEAREIKVTHLHDHDDSSLFSANVQFSTGDNSKIDPVPGIFDIGYDSNIYSGTTQSTISEGACLEVQKITDDLKNINRELDKVQVGSSDETHFRAVIPILNLKQIQNDMHHLKEILGVGKKPKSDGAFSQPEDFVAEEIVEEDKDLGEDKKSESYESSKFEDVEDEIIEEVFAQDDEFQKSSKFSEDKTSMCDEKDAPSEKLKVVSTESVTENGYEAEITTLNLVDADDKFLGEIHIGDFSKEIPKKFQKTQARENKDLTSQYNPLSPEQYPAMSFTGANNKQTWLTKSDDGHTYILQGDADTLEIIGKWRGVAADLGDLLISLVPIYGPPTGAAFSQLINQKFDTKKTLEGAAWGAADLAFVGWVKRGETLGKLAAMAPKVVKLVKESKQIIKNKIVSKLKPKIAEVYNPNLKIEKIVNGGENAFKSINTIFSDGKRFTTEFIAKDGQSILVEAHTKIEGKTLILDKIGINAQNVEKAKTGSEIYFPLKNRVIDLAKRQGYEKLVIKGERASWSSSKNPDHAFKFEYDLTKKNSNGLYQIDRAKRVLLDQNKSKLDADKIKKFLKAGDEIDRNGLTRVGRALQKHSDRVGSIFQKTPGKFSSINNQGREILKKILEDPKHTVLKNRFGGLDILTNNGGARFNSDGVFMGLLEL